AGGPKVTSPAQPPASAADSSETHPPPPSHTYRARRSQSPHDPSLNSISGRSEHNPAKAGGPQSPDDPWEGSSPSSSSARTILRVLNVDKVFIRIERQAI